MPLLGNAAMLLSFDVVEDAIPEHDDWHTHEHLPERLSLPGFVRSVKSRDGEYQFGFSMFKFPGSKERAGSLAELLKAGQASLWRIASDGGGSLVEGANVSARAGSGGVVVRVSDPASVRLLFGDRPAVVRAFAETPDGSREPQEVSIEYRSK